jgi:NAD(P)-dependent dehydrogenase (short-subunit alcohol dehydrogenase family)
MTSQHTQATDRVRYAPAAGLAGRVALVTGGSGGIGRALVRRLAAEEAAVAVGYSAHAGAAEQTAAQAAEAGARAVAVGADLRRPQAPAELVDAVEHALGPVDVLVANAGAGRAQPWEAVSSADFDEATAVNLRAPFLLAQRTLPSMQERRFWADPVHLLGRGVHRRPDRPALRGIEGGPARAHPFPSRPYRTVRCHRQRSRPRADRRDRAASRRPAGAAPARPGGPARPPRGGR